MLGAIASQRQEADTLSFLKPETLSLISLSADGLPKDFYYY
jgi:hypothetical protein